jgi:uncharacterized protein YbaA (DUF1428 family)
MAYIEGFVAAVPAANREAFISHAGKAAVLFKEFGATRVVECWGADVPEGEVTSFRLATRQEEDEVALFSWIEFPSKEARDAVFDKMMSDPRMHEIGEMPFDGKRMFWGSFVPLLDEPGTGSTESTTAYVDGFVIPVAEDKRDAYRDMAAKAAPIFIEYGATRVVECWGADLMQGEVTDFRKAVRAEPGENVVFSWIVWPSKAARDEGNRKTMEDPRLNTMDACSIFDGKRMFFGGFTPVVVGE